jgi:hypothetical protein
VHHSLLVKHLYEAQQVLQLSQRNLHLACRPGGIMLSLSAACSGCIPCTPAFLPILAGMLCAETGAMIWLLLATYLELPVSTTHSIGKRCHML